jgi:hypothetical protein
MGFGVWTILGTPDLSGGTLLGAFLFLLGLYIAQSPRPRRVRHRDSTARAVDAIAETMVEP